MKNKTQFSVLLGALKPFPADDMTSWHMHLQTNKGNQLLAESPYLVT